ncbi:MAG: peptidylprolyl isomerase, partial [Pseudomonadota bacterium]
MLKISSLFVAIFLSLFAVSHAQETSSFSAEEEALLSAPEAAWIGVAPENLVVMELPSGTMIIELRPDLAPTHIERIQTLTRQGFYDGIIFHRVIDGFMAQGGDPTGTGRGASDLPNIAGEFTHSAQTIATADIVGRDDRAAQVGFVGTVPVGTQAPTLAKFLARDQYALWGLHCQGVMSMARAGDPNSANSQFFVMFGDSRDILDRAYTVWGKVVSGYKNARRINRGEPPVRPTPIVRMRMMDQLPAEEQSEIEYLDPASDIFKDYLITSGKMTEDGFI